MWTAPVSLWAYSTCKPCCCVLCAMDVFLLHFNMYLYFQTLLSILYFSSMFLYFSALTLCWLGGRKGIRSVKKLSGGLLVWLSVWSEGADLHMAQLMPLPLTVSCYSKIQIGFTFLVLAHLGSPRKRAVKRVCVCVFLYLLIPSVL